MVKRKTQRTELSLQVKHPHMGGRGRGSGGVGGCQDLFIRLSEGMQAGKVRKCHRASFQQFILCIRQL